MKTKLYHNINFNKHDKDTNCDIFFIVEIEKTCAKCEENGSSKFNDLRNVTNFEQWLIAP